MEYKSRLQGYSLELNDVQINDLADAARNDVEENLTEENLKTCFSCLDLTSLSCIDSIESITEFASKVALFKNNFKQVPSVASICVFPNFVDVVGLALGNSTVAITSVSAGFPTSQTFLEVKMLETAMAVESGADEVDIVMNLGGFLSGDFDCTASEIEMIKDEVGEDVTLKVILETGELKDADKIYQASILAMLSGADFIKTSTGKTPVSATPFAAVVMCQAIKDFYSATDRKVGIKIAGGVKTSQDAVTYYSIVKMLLGEDWLNPSLFRIGASSLANSLLSDISGESVSYF
ncbi:MAG: deoxyribose-phosphate aldolase [Rikenellaceae bacterium]